MVLTRIISRFTALAHRCFLLVLLLAPSSSSSRNAAAPVMVGVVLDLQSEAGNKSLTCIEMALEEHPSSTTRVQLRVRDSRGNLTDAGKYMYFFLNFLIVQSNQLLNKD